jgi:Subtilase family
MVCASNDKLVELMGNERPWRLVDVYDSATGRYFSPQPNPSWKEAIKQGYLQMAPGASESRFDAVWPRIWELTEFPHDPNELIAILDTGVLAHHPLLKDCISQVVDFSGEGGEDLNGHGTMCALLARMAMCGVPRGRFLILKVVGGDGRGTQDNLIRALGWMREFNRRGEARIVAASMSLGVYNRKWLVLGCDGTCALCRTAEETSREIPLFIAAGNMRGKTACPARAAFLPSKPNIIAFGRADEATSGTGTNYGIASPAELIELRPLK